FAVRAEAVNAIFIDRGSRAGARVLRTHILADFADVYRPDFLAVFLIECDRKFIIAAIAQKVDPPAGDSGSRVTVAQVGELPTELRSFLRPLLEQPGFFR